MRLIRLIICLIYFIKRIGILNFILLVVASLAMLSFLLSITEIILTTDNLTFSEIAESRKEAIPFETLTEKQLQEDTMVEGSIFFNMGDFAKSKDDDGDSYKHYAILFDDKVMSAAVHWTDDSLFGSQATNYRVALLREGNFNVLQYHEGNNNPKNKNKKESQRKQEKVRQIIQETMESEPGIAFKGKVVKMDSTIENDLKDFVTPDGKKEPAFEIIPYEIKIVRHDIVEYVVFYVLFVLEGVIGIGALCMLIVRLRRRRYSY